MNLKEVKKHVYFNVFLYVLIGLCLLLSIFAILITPVNAAELKSYEITSGIKNTSNCGTATLGYYCFGQGSNYTVWTKTNFGSSNGYAVNDLAFDLNGTITYQNAPTTIEIYSPSNSFKSSSYTCHWSGSNQPSSCNVYRASSNHINVNFTSGLGSPQYLYISIGNTEQTSTWLDNISINKVVANQSVNDPNASVIANQNENTTNIINASNENTNSIINAFDGSTNSIIAELNDMCNNLLDVSKFVPGTFDSAAPGSDYLWVNANTHINSYNKETGSINYSLTSGWNGISSAYIPVDPGLSYYFKFSDDIPSSNRYFVISAYDSSKTLINSKSYYETSYQVCTSSNLSACLSINTKYIRISISYRDYNVGANNSISVNGLTLNVNNGSFCPFGSKYSKLDDISSGIGHISGGIHDLQDIDEQIKDIQQDQYDYLTDNTDPTVNQNGINNALSSVSYSNPLDYLLTLPTHLLQKINTVLSANTCSRVSFGQLYGTELYLPCIDFASLLGSNIWNTIDLFVGVGLLVLIIKHFYESITNILTLGKEKEVNGKLDLPTPMQFLASILGGGRN